MTNIPRKHSSLSIIYFKNEIHPKEYVDNALVGKGYLIESPNTVFAIRNTKLSITRWHYDKKKLLSYPCGAMICDMCSVYTVISPIEHAYVPICGIGKVDVPKGLICSTCAMRQGQLVDVWVKPFVHYTWMADCVFDALELRKTQHGNKVASKWKTFVKRKKEARAIKTLEPFVLHWAYRPTGPLFKMIEKHFQENMV